VNVFTAGNFAAHEFDYRNAADFRFFEGTVDAGKRYSVVARADAV
jgi:hypothetical protein